MNMYTHTNLQKNQVGKEWNVRERELTSVYVAITKLRPLKEEEDSNGKDQKGSHTPDCVLLQRG